MNKGSIVWGSIVFSLLIQGCMKAGGFSEVKREIPSLVDLATAAIVRNIARNKVLTRPYVPAAVIRYCKGLLPGELMGMLARGLETLIDQHSGLIFENRGAGFIKTMHCSISPDDKKAREKYQVKDDIQEGRLWLHQLAGGPHQLYRLSFMIDRPGIGSECYGSIRLYQRSIVPFFNEKKPLCFVRSLILHNRKTVEENVLLSACKQFEKAQGEIRGLSGFRLVQPDDSLQYRLLIPFPYLMRAQKKVLSFLHIIILSPSIISADEMSEENVLVNSLVLIPLADEKISLDI